MSYQMEVYIDRNNSGFELYTQGLWFGQMCGMAVQMFLLFMITLCTNWDKEVRVYFIIISYLVFILSIFNLVLRALCFPGIDGK